MKKLVYTLFIISVATTSVLAQSQSSDKTVRFGIYARATPSWYSMTSNNYYSKGGAVFGSGFGLALEFKVTDVVKFQTGLGGDFDGGKINYTYNNGSGSNSISTAYFLDKTPSLVNITGQNFSSGNGGSSLYKGFASGEYTAHNLLSRHIHTTYVTIPLLLKMMTKEISGMKYFVDFGGHVDVLASAKADDNTTFGLTSANYTGLNIYKDCNLVRAGLNIGAGAEYRLAGTTSLFGSINFVNSFISTVKSSSIYNATAIDANGNFTYAAQKLNSAGLQINVGILF